jgi:hypothetical protein
LNVRTAAVAFCSALLVATGPSDAASTLLTGKMTLFNYQLAGRWTCKGGGATYFAEYGLGPGNTLHGHLYSAQGSEDTYFGYSAASHRYWSVSADSNGATESQASADGHTYTGKLYDGKTTSNATNVITMVNPERWTVRARGTAGGQAYDFIATCDRT